MLMRVMVQSYAVEKKHIYVATLDVIREFVVDVIEIFQKKDNV